MSKLTLFKSKSTPSKSTKSTSPQSHHTSHITYTQKHFIYTLVGAITFFILLLCALFFIQFSQNQKTAALDILVAPLSATTTIDGRTYKNGTYHFEPGTYIATITMDNFESKEFTLNLTKGNTIKLYTYLIPSDGSYTWYDNHPEDAMLLNTIGDYTADTTSSNFATQYPIIDDLPIIVAEYDSQYNYTEYRIDVGGESQCQDTSSPSPTPSNTTSSNVPTSNYSTTTHPSASPDFCLIITDSTGGNESAAKQQLINRGYNPDDYHIIYHYTPIQPLE